MNNNDKIYKLPGATNDHSEQSILDVEKIIESDSKEAVDNFHEMNLKEELLRGIYEYGIQKPLDIQQRAILPCIMGHDVIIESPPGTGKTTSVLITILQQINTSLNECQALILTPTSTLANHIKKVIMAFSDSMKADCHVCVRRKTPSNNMCNLKTLSHVVVGTPYSVSVLIAKKSLNTKFIKIFVLDEANKLLSRSKKEHVKDVFNFLEEDTQVVLLSKSMTDYVLNASNYFVRNPIIVIVQEEKNVLKTNNSVHINITKDIDSNNRHRIETKDYVGPLMDDGTIESDWKEVVDNFDNMNLKEELLGSIYRCGFEKPLPVQQHAILSCIMGHDVIIQSPSSTGKTTSVLISILQQINTNLNECQALILTATRNLALKIQKMFIILNEFKTTHCHVCISRINIHDDKRELQIRTHVVIGTPCRVYDLIVKNSLQTQFIKIFVLDEAFRQLSDESINDNIERVFKCLEEDTQVILLSNQMCKKVRMKILDKSIQYMSNPIHILVHQKKKLTLEAIKQFYVNNAKKNNSNNGHPGEINKYSDPSVTVNSGTIEHNWNEVVDNFHEMNLKEELLHGIFEYGFEKPLAIQQRAILPCIKGHDVIVQAQSGSGKTTSVLISILQQIDTSVNECQALILTPTFELAQQIQNLVTALGKHMKAECHVCIGIKNFRELNSISHIVVGTHYYVSDLIARKYIRTKFIKIFVLDKVNEHLSRPFKDHIKIVFKFLDKDIQVIFLSNEISENDLDFDDITHFLKNPVRILLQKETLTLDAIKQFYINISKSKNGHHSETKDCLGSLMDNGETIESDWKEVVDNFHDMNLKDELLCSIYGCGFEKPSPIQQYAILPCIKGHDVIVQAHPDTGKTTSVLISILQQTDISLNNCQALILVSTSKLALKIQKMINILGEFMKIYCRVCIDGTNIYNDMHELQTRSHVVVGTPGRVYDLIARNCFQTQFIKIFVLDEVFTILSGERFDLIKSVFKCLKEDTQVIFLSNQMSKKTLDESTQFVNNPVYIFMQKEELTLKDIKQFSMNNDKEIYTKCKDANNYSGPLVTDNRGTIENDWKGVVDNFHEMNLKKELLRGIYEYGFEKPTAIQQRIIFQCNKGHDVTIQAQSVSGKTTSVLISILQRIDTSLKEYQALILVPSRKLALQIQKVVIALGKFMKVDCRACIGSKHIRNYIHKLDTFPYIVVGIPNYVYDLIGKHYLNTQFIKIFVLEKVNLLLHRHNKFQTKEVFKSLEENTQVILLSNQMYKTPLGDSTQFMSNPVRIFMQKEELTLEVFKQFYINYSKKNESNNRHPSETNDYSEPVRMNIGQTMIDNYDEMNLKEELLRGIYKCGFEKPSPTQRRIILPCIKGHNVIAQVQPGTGKTTSILISILQLIDTSLNECQALILTPTFELAIQIQNVVIALGKFMKVDCHACIDIKNIPDYIHKPDTVSHIVVGTQACVSDLISRKSLRTQFIKIFVLEEANTLLSCSIKVKIIKIFESLEKNTQVIFLSSRMHEKVLLESTFFMSNPVCIFMHKKELKLEGLKHFYVNFTKDEYKFDSLCDLFDTLSITQVVIFCNTCHKVEWLTESMRLKKFNVSAMHREMDRQQNSIALFHFHSGFIRMLITTHFFVSTNDVRQVSLIINYDLPSDFEKFDRYVARQGIAINFITEDKNQTIRKSMHSSLVQPITNYTNQAPPSTPPASIIPKNLTVHNSEANNYPGHLVTVNSRTIQYDWNEMVEDVVENFHEMNLKEELLHGIYGYGFEKPLAIQQRTILPCIKGNDVIVQAHPGTGKTTSVLISILQKIDTSLNECQALILVPSRKLARQIQKVVIAFGNFMKVNCYACIHEINTLDTFPHVVVGTPTCVYNLITIKCLRTEFIKVFMLDKTNNLLNRRNRYQINEMFKVLEKDVQVIVLSDPMPEDVLDVSAFLRNPVRITAKIDFFPNSPLS